MLFKVYTLDCRNEAQSSAVMVVATRDICRESAETIVLLEAILDGLSDEKSGAKRDLCASAAKEFLVWSAKHIALPKVLDAAAGAASASNNLNAASLLRRLFERLTHPEAYQRSFTEHVPCCCIKLHVHASWTNSRAAW